MPNAHLHRIADLPLGDRPRERLLALGARSLSDAELLALLLRTGRRGASALDLARHLLHESGGLEGLATAQRTHLARRGLGEAKVASLLAAIELGRRLARAELGDRDPMNRPALVARYLFLRYGEVDQEVLGALFLDIRNRLLTERELYRGTLQRTAVEPRAILKAGLLAGAAGMVIFHTHPSGDPAPSLEDLQFTRRLHDAGDLVGIRMVDHLILGTKDRWVSLRQHGHW